MARMWFSGPLVALLSDGNTRHATAKEWFMRKIEEDIVSLAGVWKGGSAPVTRTPDSCTADCDKHLKALASGANHLNKSELEL